LAVAGHNKLKDPTAFLVQLRQRVVAGAGTTMLAAAAAAAVAALTVQAELALQGRAARVGPVLGAILLAAAVEKVLLVRRQAEVVVRAGPGVMARHPQ